MEEVGVEAVVKGLQSFLGDMKQVNGALDGLRPTGTLLEQMFSSVSNAVSGFGREVLNVVETALGVMLRDAIEFIIGKFGELVGAIIDAGTQFQTLKIRLTGLNLNETADGIRSYSDAMALAVEKTKEELDWLQTLGSATPFDPAQIANTFTMARAFGFASDEAKRLTTDIINYTAGMGLSNETLFLVIQNMGQMVQRGKITGTEIRDLARGSYLPLADVLQRIADNMHMTVKELTQKISTPEGIPAQEFVKAFEQMVEEEPRFVGAAGRMSRALVPAAQNVKELFTSIFGLDVATPIFDVLGEKVASLVDQFAFFNEQGELIKTQKWNDLVTVAKNLGQAIQEVVIQLLGFIPSTDTLVDRLITGIQGLAEWIGAHREDIVGFFVGIGNAVNTWVIIPFQRISAWVFENQTTISGFFQALGDIISTVFGNFFGGAFTQGDFLGGLLEMIKSFMEFVAANKDAIAEWATNLIKVFLAVQLLLTGFNILIGILVAVGGFILSVIGGLVGLILTITGAVSAITFIAANFLTLVVAIGGVINVIGILVTQFLVLPAVMNFVSNAYITAVSFIMTRTADLRNSIINAFNQIVSNIRSIDWGGVGMSIIQGMANGIYNGIGSLINAAVSAAQAAYNAAMGFLQGGSPSKLFEQVGVWTMEGFAQGIQKYAGTAAGAMTSAMQQVAAPAISMPGIIQSVVAQGLGNSTTNTDARSFNLTVHSNANSEPVVQDFQMMQSLAGA